MAATGKRNTGAFPNVPKNPDHARLSSPAHLVRREQSLQAIKNT